LLGFETRYDLDGFLKAHDVWMNCTIDDLRREVATSAVGILTSCGLSLLTQAEGSRVF